MPLADEILAVLDNPTHMWAHALRELSHESQRLFLTLSLLPQPALLENLQPAYLAQSFNKTEPFLDSLRAIDDSFVSISGDTRDRHWIDFRNPSLGDFALEYLSEHSDWLDTLLQTPVYYEQIASAYELAMAQHTGQWTLSPRVVGSRPTRTYHEGAARYPGINSWVILKHRTLLAKAIELAVAGSTIPAHVRYGKSDPWTVLKQIVEITLAYGDSMNDATEELFGRLVEDATSPVGESSAVTMVDLLYESKSSELIQRHFGLDAMELLRSNVLYMDAWKFSLLCKIDEFLQVEPDRSREEWGDDFVEHAFQVANDVSNSTDWGTLEKTIRDFGKIADFLDVDIFDALSMLENRRDNLPPVGNDDYEDNESNDNANDPKSGAANSLRQLDNMFASFLE